jgi:hypothetical protein
LPHSPSPQPPQHDDQDALLQSPVDSQETVVSDSDQPMKTFVIKYGEHFISFKRPRHCFNVPNSATPDSPQSKRRIVSPESSESSSESDYSLDSSSDSDSSAICVSSDQEPSSPWPMINIPPMLVLKDQHLISSLDEILPMNMNNYPIHLFTLYYIIY